MIFRFAGGMDEVAPHLPDLVPYLVRNLNDPKVSDSSKCSSHSSSICIY
jgi:hypothetical protein